ncbi:hypothetical protein GLOIN_2v1597954 [Rhizophagus irregularis DAOM 181602=DAOM 197198]|uniref:Uncharacterized protein n=2 Tax=Rhizophagus irregularis TaxID=588596 RepID=U9TPZ5_RHIID|nr:hypothetical protein GLOIN_2v1597954 [Rhizophagus irregularis DAOM 181602=DAOM 197198]
MNNYQELFFLINQTRQRFHDYIFGSIIFRNGIKQHIIKRKTYGILNFSNFIIWNIVFFSFIPLASASIASFVNIDYNSQEDLVPKDFLATSTTMTQCILISIRITGDMQNIFRRAQMSIEEMHEKQEEIHKIQKTMQVEIDEMQTTMQTKIDEMQISMQMTMQTKIDEMQTTMQTKIDEIQKTINENKT